MVDFNLVEAVISRVALGDAIVQGDDAGVGRRPTARVVANADPANILQLLSLADQIFA